MTLTYRDGLLKAAKILGAKQDNAH